ncbi:MAG: hypothetical protein ACKVOQ_19085 [Cyclobacteriaceae bacterium]
MKRLTVILSITFFVVLFSCSERKNSSGTADDIAVNADTEVTEDLTSEQKSTATFTINGKTYTCNEVGALVYNDDNVLLISATKSNSDAIVFFSFSLKNSGKGQQKFSTTGIKIEFTTPEAVYTNTYKINCSDKEIIYTEGTITITLLEDYTNETEGKIEASFEGQLAPAHPVGSYPCGNGESSNSKAEVVTVKGTLVGSFINANKAIDQVLK